MVEGGQQVISSFLSHREPSTSVPVVDTLIVTVAPTLVGPSGVGVTVENDVQVLHFYLPAGRGS